MSPFTDSLIVSRTCSIDGCEKPMKARGWCHMHYMRWRAHGDPLWRPSTPEDRFWAKVDQHCPDGFHSQTGENLGPCWLWTASTSGKGYGKMGVGGRKGHQVYAHRFSYELLVGPIPAGLVPDHLCRVHACVNPYHLEPVTRAENIRRGTAAAAVAAYWATKRAARTHCPHGHPASEYVRRSDGRHKCRVCHQEEARRSRDRLRQEA